MGLRNVKVGKAKPLTSYRKIAYGTWANHGDSSIYTCLECDFTKCLEMIETVKKEQAIVLTPSHFVSQALTYIFVKHPELNCLMRGGRLYQRQHVQIFHQVVVPGAKKGNQRYAGADLTGCVVPEAEHKTIFEVGAILKQEAKKVLKGKSETYEAQKRMFKFMPICLTRFALTLSSFLTYGLNLNLAFLGIPKDPFGTALISNVGVFGSQGAFIPLVPYTRTAVFVAIGRVMDKPVARDEQLAVAAVLPVYFTLDHRCLDGIQLAELEKTFVEALEDPERYLMTPASAQ